MKPSHAVLAVSLVANVALLAAFVLLPADASAPAPGSVAAVAAPAPKPAVTTTSSPAAGKPWSRLSTENLLSLIARLRAAGFPDHVLRAIVSQRFEFRREELTHDDLDVPYWKKPPSTPPDPKLATELAKLEREETDTLRQLFGPNTTAGDDEAQVMRIRQYGNLSSDKISQIQAVQQSYSDQLRELSTAMRGGLFGASDAVKIDAVIGQQQAEIAKLLTPDELLEYNLRNSNTSSRLRSSLVGFNPTEEEYRALFPLYQANDAQFPQNYGISPPKPEEMAARAAAEQQMQEQIKAQLPPDRYADYLQASRPEDQQLNGLVARLDLPLSAAAQVASVQQDIQQRAGAVRVDPNLSAADRLAQSAALSDEAIAKITAVLGARGLEGYKQFGGQWLQRLQPAPRANSKSP